MLSAEAEVVWTTGAMPCGPDQVHNHLAGEIWVDDKCLMANLVADAHKTGGVPPWLPLTFSLPEDLPQFLEYTKVSPHVRNLSL